MVLDSRDPALCIGTEQGKRQSKNICENVVPGDHTSCKSICEKGECAIVHARPCTGMLGDEDANKQQGELWARLYLVEKRRETASGYGHLSNDRAVLQSPSPKHDIRY